MAFRVLPSTTRQPLGSLFAAASNWPSWGSKKFGRQATGKKHWNFWRNIQLISSSATSTCRKWMVAGRTMGIHFCTYDYDRGRVKSSSRRDQEGRLRLYQEAIRSCPDMRSTRAIGECGQAILKTRLFGGNVELASDYNRWLARAASSN